MSARCGVVAVVAAILAGCSSGGGKGGATDRCAGVTCTALDACHVAGVCDPSTGTCSNPSADDGAGCPGGTCQAGVCQGSGDLCAGVTCEALDPCHPAGTCDPGSGACVSAPAADGTACTGGVCRGGACVATSGTCEDGARTAGETGVDCGGPLCPACVDGQACAQDADCWSGWCSAGVCAQRVTALVADAGPARRVRAGAHVLLDGTRSRSPRGAIVRWEWTQTAGPAVALSGATTASPAFDAPAAGRATLAFSLTVGDGAGTATAALTVEVLSADRPLEDTSLGLLLQALDEGRLDRDTAMTYLAWSLTGDARLPAEYQGTVAAPSLTSARHVLVEQFPFLSPAAQRAVAPSLLPPAAPGSAEALADGGLPGLRSAAAPASSGWVGVSSAHAVIWYRRSFAGGASIAAALSRELEATIWPELTEVFTPAHQPVLNDAGVKLFNGGTHGKLNIYLTTRLPKGANGDEHPYHQAPTPSWIRLEQTLPWHGDASRMGLTETLAHETTHSCTDSYAHAEGYQGHRWIYEGTSTWAQDRVYPETNTEHAYAPFLLKNPWLPLDDEWSIHPYAAYLFFQYMTRANAAGSDDALMRRVWEEFQARPALQAVDAALVPPGPYDELGFNVFWSAFAEAAWNHDPAQSFWANDGLEVQAVPAGGSAMPLTMSVPDGTLAMAKNDYNHLATIYYHFTIGDPNIRQVYFYDGLTFKLTWQTIDGNELLLVDPGWTPPEDRTEWIVSKVLIKKDGAWKRHDALPPGAMLVCQDDPADRIDEFAVVLGDAQPEAGTAFLAQGEQPTLLTSNIGCYRWQGTITGVTSPGWDGPPEQISATVTWGRESSFDAAGQAIFSPLQVNASWSISGTHGGCTYAGSGAYTGAGMMAGMLVFSPTVTNGPMHRGYTAQGMPFPVSYTVRCQSGTDTIQGHIPWINTQKTGEPDWNPVVAADGLHANGSVDDGHYVWTWSFTSMPGN